MRMKNIKMSMGLMEAALAVGMASPQTVSADEVAGEK